MSELKSLLRSITTIWSEQGWVDDGNTALLAARLLTSGSTPSQAAKQLPQLFYKRNKTSQHTVTELLAEIVLANNVSKAPVDDSSELRLLFVAASPHNPYDPTSLPPLRLAAEQRDIQEGLRASSLRARLTMHTAVAARPTDLNNALNRHKPTILHISGHGNRKLLVFEDSQGGEVIVSGDLLGRVIRATQTPPKLVVLNACESAEQAKALTRYINAAIGMNASINDDTAREFAVQLYESFGEGASLQQAFDQAVVRIDLAGLAGSNIPQLYTKRGVNPTKIYF